jgi:type I protein arginine methyltransferase
VVRRLRSGVANAVGRVVGLVIGIPALRKIAYAMKNRAVFTKFMTHEEMLADHVRVNAYAKALEECLSPDDVVVDVGTGTGILAFLAARSGAKRVYAIDHSEVIEVAKAVAELNGIKGIEFVRAHSRDFSPPERVDILLHEQIGNLLFEERMVETLLDLRERALKEGGRIVPGRFRLFLDPVQLTDGDSVPFAWQQTLHGIDFAGARPLVEGGRRYHIRDLHHAHFAFPLAEREPIFEIDLNAVADGSLPTALSKRYRIVRDGRLDGFCVSFVAEFDEGHLIDSSPFAPSEIRPTSWAIPLLRHEVVPVSAGEELVLDLLAADLAVPSTWRWHTNKQTQTGSGVRRNSSREEESSSWGRA